MPQNKMNLVEIKTDLEELLAAHLQTMSFSGSVPRVRIDPNQRTVEFINDLSDNAERVFRVQAGSSFQTTVEIKTKSDKNQVV